MRCPKQIAKQLWKRKGRQLWGKSCRQVPRAMGGCPRHKLTEVSTQKSKRKSGIFVPHLGDFLKAFSQPATPPEVLWHDEIATLEDKDVS